MLFLPLYFILHMNISVYFCILFPFTSTYSYLTDCFVGVLQLRNFTHFLSLSILKYDIIHWSTILNDYHSWSKIGSNVLKQTKQDPFFEQEVPVRVNSTVMQLSKHYILYFNQLPLTVLGSTARYTALNPLSVFLSFVLKCTIKLLPRDTIGLGLE